MQQLVVGAHDVRELRDRLLLGGALDATPADAAPHLCFPGPLGHCRSRVRQALMASRPLSLLLTVILRGLARSATGMRRLSTPAS
ncbi:MAG: hypothetical protein K0Q93_1521 [Nocardioidaceae bacterium]|nr:hypothetical protein [Nocardioidaceae bacterium]